MNALIIVWRESLEAMLVIGVLLGWIARQREPRPLRRALWSGVAGGVLLAALLGLATFLIRNELEGQILETFQVAMVFVAAALIVQMVLWMRRHGRAMRRDLERRASSAAGALGVGIVTALAVAREGAETVVFLYGLSAEAGASSSGLALAEAGAGFVLALVTAWIIARGARLLSYRLLFRISEVLLLLIAASLLANGVDHMIALDWLPPLRDPVWDSSALLTDERGAGQVLARFVGYRARPCATLLIAYAAYWSIVAIALRRTRAATPVAGAA
jgi:high-affinity iron transporter